MSIKILFVFIIIILILVIVHKTCIKSRMIGLMKIKINCVCVQNCPSLGIIVAHYNENLKWLNKVLHEYQQIHAPKQINIYIYSKTNYNKKLKFKNCNIYQEKLKNVGRESHTYLHHIIKNFDQLDHINVFLTGSFGLRQQKNDVHDMLKLKTELIKKQLGYINISGFYAPQPYLSGLLKKGMSVYTNSMNSYNSRSNNKTYSVKSKIETIDKFMKLFKLQEPLQYTMNGLFAAKKENIYMRKISFYKKLIKFVNYDVNPREGFFLEMLWGAIFDSDWNNSPKPIALEL